jgi:hypothetical protein
MSENLKVRGVELHRDTVSGEYVCGYVGWGSHRAELRTTNPVHLGFCYNPERRFGLLWDIAFGYVSGFPVKSILWFTLTRSLPSKSMTRRILDWELKTGRHDPIIREVQQGGHVTLKELRTMKAGNA